MIPKKLPKGKYFKESFDKLELLDPQSGEEDELNKNKKNIINHNNINTAIGQTKNIIEQENGLEDLINQTLKVLEKLKHLENKKQI